MLLCGPSLAPSHAAEQLRLGRPVELIEEGIRFTPFDQIPMLPKPVPNAQTWTDRNSGERIEVYPADELWRLDQVRALFTNELGRVTVAWMGYPRLESGMLRGEYIERSEFEKHRDTLSFKWDADLIHNWIRDFTGAEVTGHTSIGKMNSVRYPCREYTLEGEGLYRRAFLLKVEDRRGGRFLLFLFEFPDPDRFENTEAAIYRFLRSVNVAETRNVAKTPDLRRQRASGLLADRDVSPEFAATKQRVIDQIDALDDWWYVEMPHYILVSNLDRSHRSLIDRIQRDIEQLRMVFVELVPPLEPIPEVSVIRVFDTRNAYIDYVGRENEWTLGVWMPGKKELVISPSGTSEGRSNTKAILDTAYHEAFHQYIYYALDQTELPLWMNEGHACLFEAAKLNSARKTVVLEENESRLRILEHGAGNGYTLDAVDLMHMDRSHFYLAGESGEDAEFQRAYHYASAWALVYFLRKGAPILHPGSGYEQIIPRVIEYLREHPRDFESAADHALSAVDRGRLQQDYEAFWQGKSGRSKARRHRLFSP